MQRPNEIKRQLKSTSWDSSCRKVAIDVVMTNPQRIGGPGTVVEFDESKFVNSTTISFY